MTERRPIVVVAGAVAQRSGVGGHAWVFLNWLLGLRACGYDVLFLDRTEPDFVDGPPERSAAWAWLSRVMAGAGLRNDVALLHDRGRVCVGLSRTEVLERARRADLLLNVMGYLDDEEILAAVDRKVFVDIDPGFPQLWHAQGLYDGFAGHDAVVTVGLSLGSPSCRIPVDALPHIPTLPPVFLDAWPVVDQPASEFPERITSVCTWRGPFGPVELHGERLGLRVHEFRGFVDLPQRLRSVDFELALDIDPADEADIDLLRDNGWQLTDPHVVAGDPASYRRYIQGSSAELLVAKELYVKTRGGWFSDRSACYLASGRPVVAQDSGFAEHVPVGEGLLAFTTPADASAGLAEVTGNPRRHAKAARDLAVDLLDATKVLPPLLARLGVA